ncbi:MAG: type II toxin-antitoxin system VapC family toxin [Acidobacteria bacterium]|nr:type II toxin-antitoxin system VapC family toxin [Acidobacteriota bacterium]MCA1608900.1 type II toxin-antitoxin system VapC family toxin [Acidobacteriota bacterium]
MLNLDTHILVAVLDENLTAREAVLVAKERLVVSDIVLWELAKLVQLGRLDLDMDGVAFRRSLRYLTVIPITVRIARQSTALDFRSDPADEIIAATSVVEKIPLLTRDRKILKSKMVPLAK